MLPHDQRRLGRADGEGCRSLSQNELGWAEERAGGAYEAISDEAVRNGVLEKEEQYSRFVISYGSSVFLKARTARQRSTGVHF